MSQSATSLIGSATGLCLSGGGLRGIAHLGVLQALEERGVKPAVLSGTSAGAIVGAFYAAGYTPAELLEIALETNFFASVHFRGGGLFSPGVFLRLFEQYLRDDSFTALKVPLYVAATDMASGTTHYFHSGSLHQALLASASLPAVFPPVYVDDRPFMDGGILNNLPIEPLEGRCDVLIGSHVNAPGTMMGKVSGSRQILARSFNLLMSSAVYLKAHRCHLFLDPPDMARFSMFDRGGVRKLYEYGYGYACVELEKM